MGLFAFFRRGSEPGPDSSHIRVTMIASVDELVAGEVYDLPVELADRFIHRGYATGTLSRDYTDAEVAELKANHQVVTL